MWKCGGGSLTLLLPPVQVVAQVDVAEEAGDGDVITDARQTRFDFDALDYGSVDSG